MTTRGAGASSSLSPDQLGTLVSAAERSGYGSFWLGMDRLGADLPRLCALLLDSSKDIDLGIGVVPTDVVDIGELVQALHRQDLDWSRLIVGLGSGQQRAGAFERMTASIAQVRRVLPAVRVACGAHGPRMLRHVVGQVDAICLSWLTPPAARRAAGAVAEAVSDAGAHDPELYLYTRLALGARATAQLTTETARYGRYPVHRHNFVEMGSPDYVGVITDDAESAPAALAVYDGPWQTVVRPVVHPGASAAEWIRVMESTAPRLENT